MNYIKQLNEFYTTLDYKPLPTNAIALYYILLQIANRTGWIDQFRVANNVLMSKCSLDIQKLVRARNKLISLGYITYAKGKNQTEAPLYSIVELHGSVVSDKANDNPNDNPNDKADDNPNNNPNDNINKQNETKQKHKKKNTKKENQFIPPSLEDIQEYVSSKGLNVDAKKFYDYFDAGNWIDSKGNQVKSWKQKILTWNDYNSDSKQKIEPKKIVGFKSVDTSQLTTEEYAKLMKKEITIEELIEKGRVNVG